MWIEIYWDGQEVPAVSAPLSHLFGQAGATRAMHGYWVGVDVHARQGYAFFPAPFWSDVRIVLTWRPAVAARVRPPRSTPFQMALRTVPDDAGDEAGADAGRATFGSP